MLARVAQTIWPENTAAHLAAAAGVSVRGAEHCLYGQRKWNGAVAGAIIVAIGRELAR